MITSSSIAVWWEFDFYKVERKQETEQDLIRDKISQRGNLEHGSSPSGINFQLIRSRGAWEDFELCSFSERHQKPSFQMVASDPIF